MREPTLQELISASDIAISYLRSLEADLDKELREEKKKLRLKEDELARKEKEIESLGKIFKKSIEAVSQLPEVQRSKAVRDMKKAHREIEKYTKKKK
jgi:ribosome recycling factor